MTDWKDPTKQLPKNGEFVAALRYHWKECWPLSADIIFGEVEYGEKREDADQVVRVNTCDFTGGGCYSLYFPCKGDSADSDHIAAWAYASEFKRPAFINHNPHWGKEK